jgi:hypothetical protein
MGKGSFRFHKSGRCIAAAAVITTTAMASLEGRASGVVAP